MLTRRERLREEVKALQPDLDRAHDIADKAAAENRGLTVEEKAFFEPTNAKARELAAALRQYRADDAVRAEAKEFAAAIGNPFGGQPTGQTGHLALTGKHAKSLAGKIIGTGGAKSLLAAGSSSTGVVMLDQVFEQGRPPTSILDVLPARTVAPNYSFLTQTTRTNNAAPVSAGGTKNTSAFTVTEIPATLQVVAHVSEQIPIYTLADNGNLEQFVTNEMLFGLRTSLEDQVLNGDGEDPNLTGILTTSGIQTQPFSTDILTSIRKAITKIEAQGLSADVLIISAADWEAVELLAVSTGATDVRGVPVDATTRRLWGVQAVVSNVLPADTAVLLESGSVSVDHDGTIDTRWSDAVSDDFLKNYTRCRTEGRFGLSVYRPLGVVEIETGEDES
jgi:HK97 family phage major capsid protein